MSGDVRAALEAACPSCKGAGTFAAFVDRDDGTGNFDPAVSCPRCAATGRVPIQQMRWSEIGAAHRRARVAKGESLRAASVRMGVSPATLSAMEQGSIEPAAAVTAAAREGSEGNG